MSGQGRMWLAGVAAGMMLPLVAIMPVWTPRAADAPVLVPAPVATGVAAIPEPAYGLVIAVASETPARLLSPAEPPSGGPPLAERLKPDPTPTLSPTPTAVAAMPIVAAAVATQQPARPAAALPPSAAPVQSVQVPILMYHYIRVNPDPSDRLGFNLSVPPADFAAQLAYFADHGYQAANLEDVAAYLAGEKSASPPSRSVVLSFDDGYRDFYEAAFPLLRKYRFPATVFVITGLVGRPGYMTWDQLRELAENGVSIGAHTVEHPDLARLAPTAASREIVSSKAVLEKELGRPIPLFSYPSGSYNAAVVEMVRAAGYAAAVTVNHGLVHTSRDRFTLQRVRVMGGDSVVSLAAKARLASGRP